MSADFTPEKENYKELPPFKMQVLTNFPYIEADFDALTNYQLLCKIVEYLNAVIANENEVTEQITSLYNAYVSLQDYVNNYFDNLDVTEEINNKLDEMAEDGSLTNLIKAYVDPIYQAYETSINNRVNEIDTKVDSVASGSPLVASSTSEMTDTDRVYVNTTDGKWYYYDGDSWEIGGTYQASVIDNNQIKYNMLDNNIQNYFETNGDTTIESITWTDGFWNTSQETPTESTSDTIQHASITVNAGEIYNIKGYSSSAARCWCLCDSDGKKIDITSQTSGFKFDSIIIPNNGKYLRLNQWNVAVTQKQETIVTKTNNIETNNTEMLRINNNILTLVKDYDAVKIKDFSQTIYENPYKGRWIQINVPNSADLIATDDVLEFECDIFSKDISKIYRVDLWPKKGTNYEIMYYGTTQDRYKYNFENKLCIEKINDYILHIKFRFKEVAYQTESDNKEFLFTPTIQETDNNYECDVFNIKFKNITQNKVINYIDYVTNTSSNVILETFNYTASQMNIESHIPYVGFTNWYAIGDSITEKNFRAAKNYLDYCSDDLMYINIINKGASGKGYENGVNTSTNFVSKISSMTSYDPETDIITIMGSVNDRNFATGSSLGEIGDTTSDTLYGNMYIFFDTLFTAYPGARVGIISPIPWKDSPTTDKTKLDNIRTALEETAKYFNIPYLDLSDQANLRPWDNTFLEEYYMSDGTGQSPTLDSDGIHPNSDGHRLFYQRVKEFIKTL